MPLLRHLINYLGLALVLGLLIVYFGLQSEHFLTWGNFVSLANQLPDALLIALGMTFVLIIGEIDLSVGSVMAFCGAVLGVAVVHWGWPIYLAISLALATGMACGLVNGLIVVRWRLPSFIVTLGMLEAARGAAYLVTDSLTVYIGRPVDQLTSITLGSVVFPLASVAVGGLTILFFIAVLAVLIGQGALSMTTWGRGLFALGASEETARLSGLPTKRLKVMVFMLSGLAAGMASVVLCARLSSADPNMGTGYELNAIAAVVVGGTSLLGGRGSAINTLLGVLIIAVLGSGLVQIDVDDPVKRVVTGAVIVVAVILDYYRGRWSQARR